LTKLHQQERLEMISHTLNSQESSNVCDVITCNEKFVECHRTFQPFLFQSGEIYFCQQHYEGAAAAQKAGIPIEMAYIYKS